MAEYEESPLSNEPILESPTAMLHERIGYLEATLCNLAGDHEPAANCATHYALRYGLYITPQSWKRFQLAVQKAERTK